MPRVVLSLLPLLVGFDLFARMAFGAVFEATEPGHWFDTPSPTWFGIELGLVLVLWIAAQWKAPIAGAARSRGTTRRTTRVVMVVILGVHAGLATAYSWKLPLFEGTDETSHFDYARSIAAEGRLPSLALDDEDVTDLVIDQKIQPPGYYLMMAPLMASAGTTSWSTFYVSAVRDRHHWNAANWVHGIDELGPYTGDVLTFHRLRLTGLLFSCLALLGLHRALRQARLRRGNALAVTAFAAFLPQFVHIAGILSNDLPTLALGPWIIALTLRCVRRGGSSARSSFGLRALLGVALISSSRRSCSCRGSSSAACRSR
ncbi:MAG: hypothetical protein H6834_16230 [Planctomycetes bacterium]|nr:hypothetical protein [Planctomycetota bacterium]